MKRKIVSWVLSLALVVSLVPGMSLTALADGHTHSFTYSAEGDTITATCQNDGCSLTENKVTLRIVPNSVLYYNDGQPKEASLEGLDEFNAATGKNITTDDITYYKGDTNVTAQIKAGSGTSIKGATYTARLDVEGKRATVTFKLTAKPADHVHSFTYTASGNVITATCNQTSTSMAACGLTNKQATLTLNAPEHTTYGDGKAANATFTGEIPGVTNPTINYRRSDTPLSSAPTDAGTYTAWCQLGDATARVEYTIGKANNSGWTNLPQAKTDLVYTTEPQDLITAGVPSAGTALYTVGTDPDNEPNVDAGGMPYSASVPKMTNAGTYYVWCKIDGGKNYTSIAAKKVTVTIAKATINPSVSMVGWTYGETANTPMVGDTANPGNGTVTYTYAVKGSTTFTPTVPTTAGNYTVKAAIAETANYNSGEATADFTISKAALTVTAKDQNISVGDEVPNLSDPVLDTHYTVTGLVGTDTLTKAPTLAYQKNNEATTPVNTTIGTYDIVPSDASAGDNYTISYTNGTLTIKKGKAVTATVTANNRTYDGTEKPLVTVTGEATGGTMQYALGTKDSATESYTTSIPAKTEAGTYYVWYKVVGDANHTDSTPACVTVTISPRSSSGGGGTTTYKITPPASVDNGTVTVTPQNAAPGKTVTITPKPDEGYKVDAVTVTDKNGKPVTVKNNGDGTYSFTMPASAVNAAVSFAKDEAQPTPPTPSDSEKFVDVPKDAYYHDAVYWAVDKGITEGVDATHFSPDATCTRAQMVTFLWRDAGQPAPTSSENPFTDVKEGAYYYDAVLWAVEKGVTVGTSATTFSPDDTVIRGQAVTFLWRCEGKPAPASSENPFTDVTSSDYFYQPVLWAVEKNVTAGTSKTTFSPQANCLRSQVVTFLNRAAGQE